MDEGNKVNPGEEVEKPCWQDDELVNYHEKSEDKAIFHMAWQGKGRCQKNPFFLGLCPSRPSGAQAV